MFRSGALLLNDTEHFTPRCFTPQTTAPAGHQARCVQYALAQHCHRTSLPALNQLS